MNKLKYIAVLAFLGTAGISEMKAQIKEERLILDKKREPEIRKIEKKKTAIEGAKTFSTEDKSSAPVQYEITDVPALSDFKTTELEGSDMTPQFDNEFQRNYLRFGVGNYGKFLGDGSFSTNIDEKLEVGANLHFLSTSGLKKLYDWESKHSTTELSAFLNHYGEKGKLNLNIGYGQDHYNYYGIYAFTPAPDTDLQQKTNVFKVNGYYDYYSNEILNDVRLRTVFLGDRFKAKESLVDAEVNLSKHDVEITGLSDVKMNADLGLGLQSQTTTFEILNKNSVDFFNTSLTPKITFFKGNSSLMIGSGFSFLNSKNSSNLFVNAGSSNKNYWFPKAELQIEASEELKFFAGVDGGLKLNSYSGLLEQNPYLVSDLVLKPTETKYHFYAGLKGDVNQTIKYMIAAGFGKVNDLLYFRANSIFDALNLTLIREPYDYANTFSAAYDNGTFSTVQGSVSFFPVENLKLDAELTFKKYQLDNTEKAYNIPTLSGSIGAQYSMLDKKLLLGMNTYFSNDKYTNSYSFSGGLPLWFMAAEDLNDKVAGFVDLNLSAEYKFHKNFSIFALGNNLLDKKYEQFKGYKVLGAQFLGGVKISF